MISVQNNNIHKCRGFCWKMSFCQRCKELEERILALESQLKASQASSENNNQDNKHYYKSVIELLKDANLKPSDLSQIDLSLLVQSTTQERLDSFTRELLELKPLNRGIGFIIFLKHKNPEFAVKLSCDVYQQTKEKMIRDSLEKLFPHQMPKNVSLKHREEQDPVEEMKQEILDDKQENSIGKMKKLLETLLEQAYSNDIDHCLYEDIRKCAVKIGPTDTYELFVRKELWPRFPTNLESNFSRIAFLTLHRLLKELLETFPPEIQNIIQQKLHLIQITE